MVERKTWEEFRKSKLLWFVNRTIHIFGWAIVFDFNKGREIVDVYPARVKFRGFDNRIEQEGFIGLSKHIDENIKELVVESES